jgi:hypothetical protein
MASLKNWLKGREYWDFRQAVTKAELAKIAAECAAFKLK